MGDAIGRALALAGSMTWEILWALILGFALSAVVQAVVRRATIVRLLGDDRPRTLALAAGLGAASLVVLVRGGGAGPLAVPQGRALHRGDGVRDRLHQPRRRARRDPGAADGLAVHRGRVRRRPGHDRGVWRCCSGSSCGAPRLRRRRPRAGRPGAGRVDGGPRRDGHVRAAATGSFWRRLLSGEGFTAVSHVFVMEWAAIWRDLVVGLLIAGAIAAWVPDTFWHDFFLAGHPRGRQVWGPLVGPLVAVVSFVCSIGNVPLAVGAVERRDQLRRRGRVHLRRPDHPADPQHLPAVLRRRGWPRYSARHLLRHGRDRRVRRRAALRRPRADPRPRRRARCPTRASPGTTRPGSTSSSSRWPRRWSSGSCAPAGCRCCA